MTMVHQYRVQYHSIHRRTETGRTHHIKFSSNSTTVREEHIHIFFREGGGSQNEKTIW